MQKSDARRKEPFLKSFFLLALFLFQTYSSSIDSIGKENRPWKCSSKRPVSPSMRPASPMVRRKRDFIEWEFTKKMNAVGLWWPPDGISLFIIMSPSSLTTLLLPWGSANQSVPPEWNSNEAERLRAICESRCRLLCMSRRTNTR